MKKISVILLTAALALTMLAGCGSAAGKASSDSSRTTLTVGFNAEFPPYGYMDDKGDYVGFDLDLAAEVCKRKGWELKKQPIDWDAKDMELSSGSIDCIWNGFTIQGREDDYTWSVPYVDNSQVFVVKTDSGISGLADLAGKNVGVQKDSSALAALEEDKKDLADTFGNLTQYADYNTGFMDLEAGAIDALAIDIGVANYQIAQKGDGFKMLDEQLASEQYGVGFLKGNTELKDEVEAVLLEMAADGTVLKIAKNYSDFGMEEALCIGK
ncbi:MAG: amino acid ABC transporter substrate-binding protein [Lachnospiraceae bacterium]|nr:amino acid ABC transporter substrate-binding protein [Lachnospiraceae bacterium]